MIIECPNCNKKFNLNDKLIPESGRILKCSSCDHIWHHKILTTENVEDLKLSKDNNTKLDDNISEIKKNEDEHKEEINDEKFTDINQEVLSEENSQDGERDIKDKKESDEKQGKIKMLLVYFIIVIISLLGLIFLLDTFKPYLSSKFPNITPFFDSFYEILLDFKLFIKDLTN